MKKIRFITMLLAMMMMISACGKNQEPKSLSETEVIQQESAPVSMDEQDPMQENLVDLANPPVPKWKPTLELTDEEIAALDNTQIVWGPGTFMDEMNRPTACVALQEQYGKYDTWFMKGEDNKIYLTFDEGYENGYTPVILDALKEAGISAVFFITMDYAVSEPELVQRMIDEGHVVGNHTVHHPNMTKLSLEEMKEEVMGLHEYVKENFGGYEMFLFRNPEGAISDRAMALVQSLGYQTTMWSYAYLDWDVNNQMDPATALEKTVGALHPGAVYLLHAVSSTNAAIIVDFVEQAEAKGYEFVKWTRG